MNNIIKLILLMVATGTALADNNTTDVISKLNKKATWCAIAHHSPVLFAETETGQEVFLANKKTTLVVFEDNIRISTKEWLDQEDCSK